jgi:DNA-binding CsgD family transcriptional regulator
LLVVDVAAYIERSNRAETQEQAFDLFRGVVAELGFTRSLFAGASNEPAFRERYSISDSAPIIINNYPDDWTRYYLERGYIAVDPVFASIQSHWSPIVWDCLPEMVSLDGVQKRVMDEASESGLHNGVSIPLHGPNGDAFIVSMASDYAGDVGVRQNLGQVRLVAAQFFFSLGDIWKAKGWASQVPSLTPRERECMQWTAVGKSAWEIGQILNISEATVRFHLSNAFARLGASNRIAAVVRAVRWGLVSI